MVAAPSDATTVLCVDLDGTLIRGDILWESIALLIRRRPRTLLCLLPWLSRGKAYLKMRIAQLVTPDPVLLPYRQEVLQYVGAERAKGRRVVLATATHQLPAHRIAIHLGLFDEVIATSDDRNLVGKNKLAALLERYGQCFDYVGDSLKDLPIFEAARRAVLVDPSSRLLRRVAAHGNLEKVFTDRHKPR